MSDVALALARTVKGAGQPMVFSAAGVAQVLSMAPDARDVVATMDAGATTQTMRCTSGYQDRKIGDLILVVLVGSTWQVLGKMGAVPADTMTSAEVDAAISAAIARIDIPPVVGVSWGQGPPPGGAWTKGTTVYARDEGQGARQIYLDTTAPTSGGSTKPPPPPKPPAPKTVSANSQSGWRGSQRDAHPKQGDASPWGDAGQWVGGAFYGTKIKAACDAGNVTKIEVRIDRLRGGIYGGVTMRLGTHTRTTLGKPSLSNRWSGDSIPVDGSAWVEVKGSAFSALVSGAAKGIGCGGTSSAGYAVLNIGDVRVTFG